MELVGFVQEGRRQGGSFAQLDWVRAQFRERVGFDPYPGTLNVRVANPVGLAIWRARPGIEILPGAPGYCAARCYPVKMGAEIAAAWVIPDVPDYPDDLVELMAPVSLRDTLRLKAGDVVQFKLVDVSQAVASEMRSQNT